MGASTCDLREGETSADSSRGIARGEVAPAKLPTGSIPPTQSGAIGEEATRMSRPSGNLSKRETSSHEDRGIKRVGTPITQLPGGASPCMTEHGKSEIAHTRVEAPFAAECSAPTPADSGAVDQDSTRMIASGRNLREGQPSAHGNRDVGACINSIAELPAFSSPCNSSKKLITSNTKTLP